MNPDMNQQPVPAPQPQPVATQPPVMAQPAPAPQPAESSSIRQSIGKFFNMSDGATKKEFAHGFLIWIVSGVAATIAAVILFVIAGAISGIKIDEAEFTAERPAYVYRSDFTSDLKRPYSSEFENYSDYSKALAEYNTAYKAATDKYEEALKKRSADLEAYEAQRDKVRDEYEAKTNVRDGFASIFSSLASLVLAFTVMLTSAAMWALLVRRLKDAGVSVKGIIFALATPILIGEVAFILSQFIAPTAGTRAIAEIITMDVAGYFKAMQPLIIVNLISFLVIAGIGVMTLIICFAKNTSELKGRSFFEVLKSK